MGTLLVVAVVLILAGVVGVSSYGLVEDLRRPAPAVSFAFAWDASAGTLAIAHDGGPPLTGTNTARLAVVARDAGPPGPTYGVAQVEWLNRTEGTDPVAVGDSFSVTSDGGGGDLDVERDGQSVANPAAIHELDDGDVVELHWYGPEGRHVLIGETTVGG